MFSSKAIEEMVNEFVNSLPPELKNFNLEMEKHLKSFLTAFLAKMSLVTREEFDIQCQVLVKTRLKLHQLESQLASITASNED